MKKFEKIEINVKRSSDEEISIFIPWDSNIEDWKRAFKTIMTHQEFHERSIKDLFNEEEDKNEY
jgi:hypothetical protein